MDGRKRRSSLCLTSALFGGFAHLERFLSSEGHTVVPYRFKTEDGYRLGAWVGKQRNNAKKDGRLSAERIERLEALKGWVWAAK